MDILQHRLGVAFALLAAVGIVGSLPAHEDHDHAKHHGRDFQSLSFNIKSVRDGRWSDPKTWQPARVPKKGDLVMVSRGTRVEYDVESKEVIRLLQVVGVLSFARDRNTELNVGVVKVQNSEECSESGFACDFHHVNLAGEPQRAPDGPLPALEIGTPDRPIPREFTARIRLHYLPTADKNDAPAIAACSSRWDVHGAPMSRTWVDLGADAKGGETTVELSEAVEGWHVGDEVLVTASEHHYEVHSAESETRHIKAIDGTTITLDQPLEYDHFGTGKNRSEVANLTRNVIIESADPDGVRGHTVYHQYSLGSISYARFAHLGKKGTLGRYPIHFHLIDDTMRGSRVLGAAIVDSHNRWVTVHGTDYMLVRDCVGYRSHGHGFFLEDGSEVYAVFDRNLGVQAVKAARLPDQVMPFDPNDGAAFWWANGRNTFIRNTSCENEQYGYRYDSQKRSNFDSNLYLRQPSGEIEQVDIRTLPIYRFEDNEAHTEGLYGMALAGTDLIGPDTQHPHTLRNLNIWQVHYALRSQLPTMLIENVTIDHAAYGIYRPQFVNHVYRNLTIAHTETEPFNRGLDDDSLQHGSIAVDGLTFITDRYGSMPLIQMSDNNPTGAAESHFRNVKVVDTKERDRNVQPLVSRGGGRQVEPETPTSVPVYLHDWFGKGKHAKVVNTHAKDFSPNQEYRSEPPLTGKDSRVAEVTDVEFPKLLDPVDDQPPATIITWPAAGHRAKLENSTLVVRGTTTDNERTRRVLVNGVPAESTDYNFHQWEVRLTGIKAGELTLTAVAEDEAGNVEQTGHVLTVIVE